MTRLSDTIAHLSALRAGTISAGAGTSAAHLTRLSDFGTNPGALAGWTYIPADLRAGAPLVVVLHGCTQDAAGYDRGAGWSTLADRHGFALLFPEQRRTNNPNLCFNWFEAADIRRDSGEAMSIRQMVATVCDTHAIDRSRIFVNGLSAGGAMAAVMLATYPEIFAGGAIIAGLPYGCAGSVPQALERMRGQDVPDAAALEAVVRRASAHDGGWPILSVWHGTADTTVFPANADAIVAQWRQLHGVATEPDRQEMRDGHPLRVWCDRDGRPVIEAVSVAGMGHGTPLATLGGDGCGAAGPHMIEAGISSTRHIAHFWGIAPAVAPMETEAAPGAIDPARDPQQMISAALRAAGLMR